MASSSPRAASTAARCVHRRALLLHPRVRLVAFAQLDEFVQLLLSLGRLRLRRRLLRVGGTCRFASPPALSAAL